MKLLILSLLSVLLGILIYLNFTFNSAKSVSNGEKDYLTQEYTITKVDKQDILENLKMACASILKKRM
ncbi:hypothetical protein WQ57_11975 [Mesobacillus campisalis]|uniref:Uncharacterized protein n=1 Tax=Mesobacillus campisalis TaxID=1408103 RepID=A0A0M2SW08_9BACI|nr:hypothetical protein WQ57_11975 [Mesobacillus campisalis]